MYILKGVIISGVMMVTLASGAALAQSDIVTRPARPSMSELGMAQQALDGALDHLRKVPNPQSRENVRAMNFIKLAQQQLQSEGSLYPIN